MALTLTIPNFKRNNLLETAKVGRDASKGQAVVELDNAQNIAAHDYLLLGKRGGGVSKVYQVLSVSGESVTLTENLEFYLERGQDVTKLFGSQFNVYRAPYSVSATPTTSDFTKITSSAIAIDPDQQATAYTDSIGSDQFWYCFTYVNSYTTGETPLSDSTPVRDTSAEDYTSLDAIRHEAGFDGNNDITDEDVNRKRQAAQGKINGMLAGRYVLPFAQPVSPMIADLTTRLAAGYLMIAEYGTFDGQDKTKGEKKRDDALAELKDIQSGSTVVTDLQAIDTTIPDAGGFSSGINANSSPRMFSTSDILGYNGREY